MKRFDVTAVTELISSINGPRSELEKLATLQACNLANLGHLSIDLRSTSIQDIITVLGLLQIQYIYIAECLLHFDWWNSHGLSHLTNEQKMENASRYSDHISFASFHQAYATYEGTLRQVHHSIDQTALNESTDGMFRIFQALSKMLSSSFDKRKFKELHVMLGLIRNTIHNLGCYRNSKELEKSITYKGKTYEFKHLKPVLFLYPEFIIDIIYETGLVLTQIATDPVVMALPHVKNIYRENLKGYSEGPALESGII